VGPKALRGESPLRPPCRPRCIEQPEVACATAREGREPGAAAHEHAPDARGLLAKVRRLFEGGRLEVVGEESVRTFSLRPSRYEVKDAIALFPVCQTCIDAGEHGLRRHVDPRVHHDQAGLDLLEESVDLVPPGDPEGGPPDEEVGDVGPEADRQAVQAGGAEANALRARDPNIERPFKLAKPWYPILPLIFCGSSLFMLYRSTTYAYTRGPAELMTVAALALYFALAHDRFQTPGDAATRRRRVR